VLYGRAGTGWSTSTPLPRTVHAVTEKLNHIVNDLGSQTSPVLVGHSLGALYGRRYAQRYPVMGLVLLDPDHEDYRSFMPPELAKLYASWDPDAALPDDLPPEILQLYRDLFAAEMIDWPDHIRSPLLKRHVLMEWIPLQFENPVIHSAYTRRSAPVARSQASPSSSYVQPERMGSRTLFRSANPNKPCKRKSRERIDCTQSSLPACHAG
jgi:pimeloyl-ACP methyl ester carboxylesterase